MNKTYTVDFILDDVQLSRANTEFNVRNLRKIEVDTIGRWHLYYKDKHTKSLAHFCQYWENNSLIDRCRKEYILTGKKRYFEWIGQSVVEKTDDAKWIKEHAPMAGDPPERVYHASVESIPTVNDGKGLGNLHPSELRVNNTEDTKPTVNDDEED